MKQLLIFLCLFLYYPAFTQFNEDFSDGDFSFDPTWSGDISLFEIESEEGNLMLNSNGLSADDVIHLSTPNTSLINTTWQLLVDMRFNPSSTNKFQMYLVSDQSNLESTLNGYYIEIGQTGDEQIKLFRQDGNTKTNLFTDTTELSGNIRINLKVTRDAQANWSIFADMAGGSDFALIAPSFIDNTYTNTSYFGFACHHTSTRNDLFYIDDISIQTEVASFNTTDLGLEATNSLRLSFNQPLDVSTAENPSNYILSAGFGNPISAEVDQDNSDQVILTFLDDFVNNDYRLTIDQVQNKSLDEIINDQIVAFKNEVPTSFRSIVINEIYADFNPSALGLPDKEFIELLNITNQTINVDGFKVNGQAIANFELTPNAYLIITDDSNLAEFQSLGDVTSIASFPNLTNGGLELILTDNLGNLVDSISYTDEWYLDPEKDDGGFTLEQINPQLYCNHAANWAASNDEKGGTPGTINSIFNDDPDTQNPSILSLEVVSNNTIKLIFDEPMDESTLLSANYIIDPEIGVNSVSTTNWQVIINLAEPMKSGRQYTITVNNVTDCVGNDLVSNVVEFEYDIEPPRLEEIYVNDAQRITLFFNEEVTVNSAEKEGNYLISPAIETPQKATLDESNSKSVSLVFSTELLEEVTYTLTLSNLSDRFQNIMLEQTEHSFVFQNNIDNVFVLGPNQLQVLYDVGVTENSATSPNNYLVSHEIGHPIAVNQDVDNNKLIDLLFQQEFDDNRQLSLFVSNILDLDDGLLTTPETHFEYDTSPPKLDSVVVIDNRKIEIIFQEKVEKTNAQKLHFYQLNENEYPIHAVLDETEKVVLLEFQEDFSEELENEIRIDQVEDLYGNAISTRLKGSFIFDTTPPKLDSLIVRSENQIILFFHEAFSPDSADDLENYLLDDQFMPDAIQYDTETGKKVVLNFENDFSESTHHELKIINIADLRGNTRDSPIVKLFDNTSFYISEIIVHSSSKIELLLNKTPEVSSATVLSNYTIENHPIKSISIDDHSIFIELEQDLIDKSEYQMTVENLLNGNELKISIENYTFLFDSKLTAVRFENDQTIEMTFETDIQTPLVNTLFEIDNQSPSYGLVSTERPNTIRLFFDQKFLPNEGYLLQWHALTNVFGNKIPGYKSSLAIDTYLPEIINLTVINNHQLQVNFNEQMDEVSTTFLAYYEVMSLGNPSEVSLQEGDSTVLLSFESEFISDQVYQLEITNVQDLAENVINSTKLAFTYHAHYLPKYGELIISEIMSDPNEGGTEFVELYNASDQTINLEGLIWQDGTGQTYFSYGVIAPNSYLVVAQKPLTADLNYGELGKWLTLNNSGETLSIYAEESLVFSTSYDADWYQQDDTKGFSLEMVDLNNFCGEESNWSASLLENGTPGKHNSNSAQNPDNFGPSIQSVILPSPSAIQILMNEKLIPTINLIEKINLSPQLTIEQAQLISPENMLINIELSQELIVNQPYKVSLKMITDCASNLLEKEGQTAEFWLPQIGDSLDLIINEILFNPKTGGVDFVEIYNNSSKYIDLMGWQLESEKSNSVESKIITDNQLIISPHSYLVFTSDIDLLNANYPISKPENFISMTSFPSFNDDEGIVKLRNNNQVTDQFNYSADFHSQLLDDVEGVSLERIDFDATTNDHNSWQSAASTSYYATPGLVNSQFLGHQNQVGLLKIEPKTFFPDGTGQDDFTTIRYQLNQTGNVGNILIYDTQGRVVKSLAENQLLATSGFFTWDGTSNSGYLAQLGYYIVYFEIFDDEGNKSLIKETLVLGGRL